MNPLRKLAQHNKTTPKFTTAHFRKNKGVTLAAGKTEILVPLEKLDLLGTTLIHWAMGTSVTADDVVGSVTFTITTDENGIHFDSVNHEGEGAQTAYFNLQFAKYAIMRAVKCVQDERNYQTMDEAFEDTVTILANSTYELMIKQEEME